MQSVLCSCIVEDISPKHSFVVSMTDKGRPLKQNIDIVSLKELKNKLSKL
jgi:hypothetical protein